MSRPLQPPISLSGFKLQIFDKIKFPIFNLSVSYREFRNNLENLRKENLVWTQQTNKLGVPFLFISCVVLNKTDRVHLYSISNVWNIFQIIKRLSCDCPNTLIDKCDFSFSSYRSFQGIDLQPSSWQNRMQKHFLQKRSLSEIRLLAHKSQVEWHVKLLFPRKQSFCSLGHSDTKPFPALSYECAKKNAWGKRTSYLKVEIH